MWYRAEFFNSDGKMIDLLLAQNIAEVTEYAIKIEENYDTVKVTTIKGDNNDNV